VLEVARGGVVADDDRSACPLSAPLWLWLGELADGCRTLKTPLC